MPETSKHVTHMVFLVHGTFVREAAWAREGTPLRNALKRVLGEAVHYRMFLWSGKNSHSARLSAAGDLSKMLVTSQREFPHAQQVVIAHSHGGNVALYAMRNLEGARPKVVTLATPFIAAVPRNISRPLDLLCSTLNPILRLLIGGSMVSMLLLGLAFAWSGTFISIAAAIVGFLILAVLMAEDRIKAWIRGPLKARLIQRQSTAIAKLWAKAIPDLSMLAIAPVRDEARTALHMVDGAMEVPHGLSTALSAGAEVSAFSEEMTQSSDKTTVAVCVTLVVLAALIPSLRFFLTMFIGGLAILSLLYMLWFLPVLFLGYGRKLAHSDESPVDFILIRVFASALPRSDSTAVPSMGFGYQVDRGWRRLLPRFNIRHSAICMDDRVVNDVANWVASGETPKDALRLA